VGIVGDEDLSEVTSRMTRSMVQKNISSSILAPR